MQLKNCCKHKLYSGPVQTESCLQTKQTSFILHNYGDRKELEGRTE